jgi:hypothetical protein
VPDTRSGSITVYYLIDVAERIDLAPIPSLVDGQAALAVSRRRRSRRIWGPRATLAHRERGAIRDAGRLQPTRDKLDTLDDICRFSGEHIQVARGHLLELTILLILIQRLTGNRRLNTPKWLLCTRKRLQFPWAYLDNGQSGV